jgi:hypothetical protein
VTVPRLKSFLFVVRKPDGSTRDVVFYAASVVTAKRYAEAWAAKKGFSVALVPNEVSA